MKNGSVGDPDSEVSAEAGGAGHRAAQGEHGGGVAVVGALVAVLLQSTPEFGHDHHRGLQGPVEIGVVRHPDIGEHHPPEGCVEGQSLEAVDQSAVVLVLQVDGDHQPARPQVGNPPGAALDRFQPFDQDSGNDTPPLDQPFLPDDP